MIYQYPLYLRMNQFCMQRGYWGHTVDDESVNGMLEYYNCPPGYCRCNKVGNLSDECSNVYHYDNDDLQCVCDREGKNKTVFIKLM